MSEAKTKRKRRPEAWQLGEHESWFTHMSAEGWHLDDIVGDKAYFTQGEPMQYTYRVDFGNFTEARIDIYAQSGWEYVCDNWDMGVLRSPADANTPEIYSDPAELAYAMRKIRNRTIRSTLFLMIIIYFLIRYIIKNPGNRFTLFNFITFDLDILFIQFISIISGMYLMIKESMSTARLVSQLRKGRSYNHEADWRKPLRKRNRYYIILGSIITIYIWMIIQVNYIYKEVNLLPTTKSIDISGSSMSIIRLADIENDTSLIKKPGHESRGIDHGNSIEYRWSPAMYSYIVITENGTVPERPWKYDSFNRYLFKDYSPHLSVNIYHLRFSWMTPIIFQDLFRKDEDSVYHYRFEPYDDIAFDDLRVHDGREYDTTGLVIYAKLNDYIFKLQYTGEESIETVLELLRDMVESI
ncbi:MAG: DUF2812 domain-containing protein [Oscillospiraceae bacterium]|nr:DUF2812 domain-containing protein [Oscillospiraceae bacterium]